MSPDLPDPRAAMEPELRLKVNEIFYSLQGESTRQGLPCVLIRLTGCQMRCSWCDSEHSFFEGRWMTRVEIIDELETFSCPMVELTGGEPLLQPGALPLLEELCDRGYEVLLETGGGLDISKVDERVRRIVDVKCPASGESEANRWENLEQLRATDEVKFVLADEADYGWASEVVLSFGLAEICPVHFSPVQGRLEPRDLAAWILRDRLPVRLAMQLHKTIWGNDARAV